MTDRAYDFFGVHKRGENNGKYQYLFRLPCLCADRVELIGDFNLSEPVALSEKENGVWEVLYESDIPLDGMKYTYKIFSGKGSKVISDPFALYSDVGNNAASIIRSPEPFDWQYQKAAFAEENGPLNILCIKLEDWNSKYRFDTEPCLNYRDLKDTVSDYLEKMSYTHIELADVCEGNLFAAALYGTPDDFKIFTDEVHRARKGVIVDFRFDNSFECIFTEELYDSFFLSAVLYWFREFNVDGMKLNAGELRAFKGERASDFLKFLNRSICREFPSALIIVDDIFGESVLTGDREEKEICFSFKCNHGWRKDFFDYIETPAEMRALAHSKLTFSLRYFFFERFILPLSEDALKPRQDTKLLLGAMIMHPGKKMICEPNDPFESDKTIKYRAELNCFYLKHPQLWELDSKENGFKWVVKEGDHDCVIAYKRFSMAGDELLCVFNFSSVDREDYVIEGLDTGLVYREAFNSDDIAFGGNGRLNKKELIVSENGRIEVRLPPLSVVAFESSKNKSQI